MTKIDRKWIEDNLFTVTGSLNNRVCNDKWWTLRGYDDYLASVYTMTDFLDDNVSFAERLYVIFYNLKGPKKCHNCSNSTNFKNFKTGYQNYCSSICSTKCPDRNAKIVRNTDHHTVVESVKKFNLRNYGVEYFFQSEEFKKKSIDTKIERYGDENYNNIEAAVQTNLKKYGVKYTTQVPDIIDKIQKTKSSQYPQLRCKKWLEEQNKTKSIQEIANDLGVTYRTVWLWFEKHNIQPIFYTPSYCYGSNGQKEIFDFLKSLDVLVINNERNIIPLKEIDLYLPEYKIGIEYNGMFWHKEDRKRHIQKKDLCTEVGVELLQFWDYEWHNKQNIVKSIIKTKLNFSEKIYARKCKIRELLSNEYSEFLENNHIQGNVNSSIRYGLIYNDQIVSIIGVGKSRYGKKHSHELLRFCNKLEYTVIGGFSRLLNYVLKNHDIKSLITFCDKRIFSGDVYEKCGFTYSHSTLPGYVYYKSGMIKNRLEFQKHKLKDFLPIFDESKSEHVNANVNGWYKVYDCGQDVYYLNKESYGN